jgi:hypothetical protein
MTEKRVIVYMDVVINVPEDTDLTTIIAEVMEDGEIFIMSKGSRRVLTTSRSMKNIDVDARLVAPDFWKD